jgi:hypothetical protein
MPRELPWKLQLEDIHATYPAHLISHIQLDRARPRRLDELHQQNLSIARVTGPSSGSLKLVIQSLYEHAFRMDSLFLIGSPQDVDAMVRPVQNTATLCAADFGEGVFHRLARDPNESPKRRI